jgi:hypothetical protein
LGEIIVSLQGRIRDGQEFQVGAAREVDGQRGTLSPLAMTTGQDKGYGRKARGMAPQGLAKGGSEFLRPIIIEQAKELNGKSGGGFAVFEGGLQKGLAFRDQSGEAAGRSRAQGFAFLLEQGLAMQGVFNQLMAVIGAAMRGDFE